MDVSTVGLSSLYLRPSINRTTVLPEDLNALILLYDRCQVWKPIIVIRNSGTVPFIYVIESAGSYEFLFCSATHSVRVPDTCTYSKPVVASVEPYLLRQCLVEYFVHSNMLVLSVCLQGADVAEERLPDLQRRFFFCFVALRCPARMRFFVWHDNCFVLAVDDATDSATPSVVCGIQSLRWFSVLLLLTLRPPPPRPRAVQKRLKYAVRGDCVFGTPRKTTPYAR